MNSVDNCLMTRLMCAVIGKHKTCVEKSIEAGADVNSRSSDDITNLMYAVKNGDEQLVDI